MVLHQSHGTGNLRHLRIVHRHCDIVEHSVCSVCTHVTGVFHLRSVVDWDHLDLFVVEVEDTHRVVLRVVLDDMEFLFPFVPDRLSCSTTIFVEHLRNATTNLWCKVEVSFDGRKIGIQFRFHRYQGIVVFLLLLAPTRIETLVLVDIRVRHPLCAAFAVGGKRFTDLNLLHILFFPCTSALVHLTRRKDIRVKGVLECLPCLLKLYPINRSCVVTSRFSFTVVLIDKLVVIACIMQLLLFLLETGSQFKDSGITDTLALRYNSMDNIQ